MVMNVMRASMYHVQTTHIVFIHTQQWRIQKSDYVYAHLV